MERGRYKGHSGKEKCIRSAYMIEYAAFNVIDEDKRQEYGLE